MGTDTNARIGDIAVAVGESEPARLGSEMEHTQAVGRIAPDIERLDQLEHLQDGDAAR